MSDTFTIAPLTLDHYYDSMALSQFAFQTRRTPQEIEEGRSNPSNEAATVWGAFVDGKLASKTTVLNFDTYIGGKRFKAGGIGGVATWPEYRRQGLVAALLVHSLKEMKVNGQTISYLAPFAYGFYRKFGWETYCNYKTYTIKSNQLPKRIQYSGTMKRYSDISQVYELYENYAVKYNGMLSRTPYWWDKRVVSRKKDSVVVYHDANDQAQGYIIYEVLNRTLTVHEFVHLNEEAYSALWSFIGQHDSMIASVFIPVPDEDILPYLLDDPRIKQETSPHFMARIVDVEAFFGQFEFNPDAKADKLTLQIEDVHAPWNAGRFVLSIDENGAAKLEKIEENLDAADIQINIGHLSSVMLGYRKLSELSYFKRISGHEDAIKRLQNRIPERLTQLVDFF